MRSDAITLADVAAKFRVLEVACRRCERRGRLRVERLIEQHGSDMGLPELGDILRSDCPKREAAAVGERCSIYYPQPLQLGSKRASPSMSFDDGTALVALARLMGQDRPRRSAVFG